MKRLLCMTFALFGLLASAQTPRPVVSTSIDRDSMSIGDRFTLNVQVDKDIMQVVDFPSFEGGMMTDRIEVVAESGIDTLSRNGRRVSLAKKYLLTTFDEGIYSLAGFPVLYMDKNVEDTIESGDSLRLLVSTFEIDTATSTIYDIKAPLRPKVKFGEWSGWALCGLLGAALVAFAIYMIVRWRKGRPIFGQPKPKLPPHVAAIRALEALNSQKLWQNGKHKAYYTRLTDIMRQYLKERYGIQALEMTSDEIMSALSAVELEDKNRGELSQLLKTADFVKFAKYAPDAEQNEIAYYDAYYFVEDTKEADAQPQQEDKEVQV